MNRFFSEIGSVLIGTPGILMLAVWLIEAGDIPFDTSGNRTRALLQILGLLCSSLYIHLRMCVLHAFM